MQAIERTAADSKAKFPPVLDIILALQDILAHSQVPIPDLETPYSQVTPPNANYIAIELKDRTVIGTIIIERHQQLDVWKARRPRSQARQPRSVTGLQ
ncbi:uncharacterized protein BJ212DRAFT_1482631 [Suillus subaureus]|uniref:Uncharacterized protein n=1 Tax=Suillus subaureus TaxID=48587 RepID=A0A9P7JBR5_9AGAM|nr:uncharacterized protein BJ212DRAFT_1482631 [Suillus subaureus]KAG1813160.1 hypothetical protein BJ212DRAFT_1482631 [Suillus subaureus]